ncbi:MAG: hypothetical protein RM347_030840, partial [Nostoc sp. ChiQUE02]|uniref:hypothetical protein n=1 Tax=Nostoc sp. ChiQUE02 TaxID=3075377 RepID=UPI003D16080D
YNSYICTAISKYILEQFVVYDLLEPDALQGASPVLRGRDYSDIVLLPDHGDALHGKVRSDVKKKLNGQPY